MADADADADDVRSQVGNLQQLAHARQQRCFLKARRIVRSEAEMDYPFFRMAAELRGPDLTQRAAGRSISTPRTLGPTGTARKPSRRL
jgi:hypothetical protein